MRCLRDGARCLARLDQAYRRYGYQCAERTLWLDPALMLPILRRRVLHIPSLPVGADCPRTPASGPLSEVIPGAVGPALGIGPAYPGLYYPPQEVGIEGVLFDHPNTGGPADRGVGKVLWQYDPTYRGRVILVRGREVTGSNEVLFQRSLSPDLVIQARNGLSTASEEWFKEPGCYAFQLDGPGFSRVVVFEARRVG